RYLRSHSSGSRSSCVSVTAPVSVRGPHRRHAAERYGLVTVSDELVLPLRVADVPPRSNVSEKPAPLMLNVPLTVAGRLALALRLTVSVNGSNVCVSVVAPPLLSGPEPVTVRCSVSCAWGP